MECIVERVKDEQQQLKLIYKFIYIHYILLAFKIVASCVCFRRSLSASFGAFLSAPSIVPSSRPSTAISNASFPSPCALLIVP